MEFFIILGIFVLLFILLLAALSYSNARKYIKQELNITLSAEEIDNDELLFWQSELEGLNRTYFPFLRLFKRKIPAVLEDDFPEDDYTDEQIF